MELHETGLGVYLGDSLDLIIIAPSKTFLRACLLVHWDADERQPVVDLGCGWAVRQADREAAKQILRAGIAGTRADIAA